MSEIFVVRFSKGPLGHAVWGFECCGNRWERTSPGAAIRVAEGHNVIHHRGEFNIVDATKETAED